MMDALPAGEVFIELPSERATDLERAVLVDIFRKFDTSSAREIPPDSDLNYQTFSASTLIAQGA
jgi:hypothetical protein